MKENENILMESFNRSINKLRPDIRNSILNDCATINMEPTLERKRKYIPKIAYGIVTCYIIFFLAVNTIPVSAQILYKIPFIDKLVWSSVIDKGIFEAFEGGYTQPINKSITNTDVTFAVHDLMVGNKIHFLMSIESSLEIYGIESVNILATDQDGKSLSFTSKSPYYDKNSGAYIFDCNIVTFNGDAFKDISSINLQISSINFDDSTKMQGEWEIEVPIQADSSTEEALWEKEINENILKDDGSSFLIEKVVSTPSDIAIYIKMDSKYSRSAPRNVYIADNEGIEIPMINVLAQKDGDITQYKYYFNSTHPNKPVKFGYNDGDLVKEIKFQ